MLDLIAWRSNKSADKPALFFNGRWYSYFELNVRANRLANRLADLGVEKGDRVGIVALNHPAHFDLMLAAPKLGFIYTPFNYRLTSSELAAMARQVQPRLVFADSRHQNLAEAMGVAWSRLSDYKGWLLAGSAEQPPAPSRQLTADDPHMLLFTGGTTGIPKAAVLPYRQTLLNARITAETWGLSSKDTTIQCTPCFHAAVNVLATPMLYKGGRVVLMSKFDADEFLGHVGLHKVSHVFLAPTMYQMLSQHYDFRDADFSSLRMAISGGAPCPESVQRSYAPRGVFVIQGYGLSEAGVNCFVTNFDRPDIRLGSVGVPMPNMEARVVDEDGALCPQGFTGELQLRGPMVFNGYWEQVAETAQALKDGWLETGDMACCDGEGRFSILGRKKDLYISGGEKIFPMEVEAAIDRIPQVAECAVFGVPDAQWGEQGLAAIATNHGQQIADEELRRLLRASLAGYKVPKHFYFMRSLPRNAAGKVIKSEIRKLYEDASPEAHSSRTLSRAHK